LTDLYRELGYFERLTAIEEEWPGANILLHKGDGLPQVSLLQNMAYKRMRWSIKMLSAQYESTLK
jgi:hypothetical protein